VIIGVIVPATGRAAALAALTTACPYAPLVDDPAEEFDEPGVRVPRPPEPPGREPCERPPVGLSCLPVTTPPCGAGCAPPAGCAGGCWPPAAGAWSLGASPSARGPEPEPVPGAPPAEPPVEPPVEGEPEDGEPGEDEPEEEEPESSDEPASGTDGAGAGVPLTEPLELGLCQEPHLPPPEPLPPQA
jgi:hypothetical protein